MESETKRERRERRRKEQREQMVRASRTGAMRRYLVIGGWGLSIGVVVAGIVWLAANREPSYSGGPVHWHAKIHVFICGKEREFPGGSAAQHVGTNLIHHHGDQTIHIEGVIPRKEDVMLGEFFDAINVPFSSEEIFDSKNGNGCNDGKENKVHLFVNEKENTEFRDALIHDKDTFEIRYE